MRKVVEVPRDTMASPALNGKERMVDGLSPVKGAIWQSLLKPYLLTKYWETEPMLPPPSRRTSPSFLRRVRPAWLLSADPAVRERRRSDHEEAEMSQRFMPQTSDTSIGATVPRKRDVRKEETREMRDVLA